MGRIRLDGGIMLDIPVVILCGGSGTRLKEMTEFLPKPLVPIGEYPMVVHIMRWYAKHGATNFILALGYRQDQFKYYFTHYDLINNDITVDIGRCISRLDYQDRGWRVTLCDTGLNTLKGGRLKRIEKYITKDTFMCTYGDGIADIDINALLDFHFKHGRLATITGVHPQPRFGEIWKDENDLVVKFAEKEDGGCLVNGGFMVFNRRIFDYLDTNCDLELGVFDILSMEGELAVYHHPGFWKAMDTMKDMDELQEIWAEGTAKWRV
jgi:glucose-1-phosphate cytidylyltransferase